LEAAKKIAQKKAEEATKDQSSQIRLDNGLWISDIEINEVKNR